MSQKRKQDGEEQIAEKRVAVAAGGSSGGFGPGGGNYRPGNTFKCKIEKKEPGGYAVSVVGEELMGFLPTKDEHKIGADFVGTFVCIHNRRMLFSSKISPLVPS